MTSSGGSNDKGTIFRISTTGVGFAVLHSFDGETGAYPDGHLVVRENFGSPSVAMMVAQPEMIVDVSPNPSAGDFLIAMTNPADEKVHITITDMNGLVVHDSELTMTEPPGRVGKGLPKGIYILKARVNERTTMHRLVKK